MLRDVVRSCLFVLAAFGSIATSTLFAQTLDERLQAAPAAHWVKLAREEGNAARGAVVFFQPTMACSRCHSVSDAPSPLGPSLVGLPKETTDEALIESVLTPSKVIRPGYASVTLTTKEGQTLTGIVAERTPEQIVLRDMAKLGESITIATSEIDELKENTVSLMPAGQMNQLTSEQQFLDLIRYLIEIRDGGAVRARELQPAASLLVHKIPEYEKQIDHAGLIRDWNDDSFKRGEAIYRRVCANCHGTKDQPGSLPNSLRFAEGKFKNGSDPHSMYQTLTRGFGLMVPQTWMVPSQKYDVIHYIRETYIKPHNPSQFVPVNDAYLAKLPVGNTRGPEPSLIEPWSAMDYGSQLTHTYEIPGRSHNFAYKGIAVRLDPGAGGVSRGHDWLIFDTDTLRVAAAWNATEKSGQFIDWRGIQMNGEHQIHPRIVGQVNVANSTGPGWADPRTNSFEDTRRVEGRDGHRYGPLPRDWARYRGMYYHGDRVVLSYTIGKTKVLELPRLQTREGASPLVLRTFEIGPRERDLTLQIAEQTDPVFETVQLRSTRSKVAVFQPSAEGPEFDHSKTKLEFDGATFVEIPNDGTFDLAARDFTIAARIKTTTDGTIFALAEPGPKWTPNGQTFFVRGGQLGFDIGWVGAVTGRTNVSDGKWHNVAVTFQKSESRIRLFVDGKLDGQGTLAAKAPLEGSVARIGFTAPNFPQESYFTGELAEVRFHQRQLTEGLNQREPKPDDESVVGRWVLSGVTGDTVTDASGKQHDGKVVRGEAPTASTVRPLLTGIAPQSTPAEWKTTAEYLRIKIPAGTETLRFSVWTTEYPAEGTDIDPVIDEPALDLEPLTHGGPARWPQVLETTQAIGSSTGPFASDVMTAPDSNPWLAQLRFTGLDFLPEGNMAACTWDGDVWLIEGIDKSDKLRWQRIATGLFQPLGLKIVNGKIHLTCRDQLCVLHDLNGDREIDFYECLNNDHQVTEHFHEFAMGLQTDAKGNFYYAKSGRHALKAVVPHHGTLLRVSPDGERTEILANGFRAANGVCLNPDGSFVVTDQEGFWNPKNRINWVTLDPSGKPKFYGNLFGYTDVTDESDSAMEPPLCWITNAFDRSPAELLWVDSPKWGQLNGALLNLSYGYGKVFLVPHEPVGPHMQGGMIELPMSAFPTGVMRGRFRPDDGDLYVCGMFAWAGSATEPGGLYRLRATGQPMRLPRELHATKSGLKLTFTEPVDANKVKPEQFQIQTWSLKRTANYGSKHFDEKALKVRGVTVSEDGKTVTLDVADLQPTWGMEIKYQLPFADGKTVEGVIHNTIHALTE